MKFRVLLLLALFLAAISAIPLQAQQGLLLLEKGSVKVIGPERTRLLRKPGAKIVLHAKDRVQTGKETSVKIRIRNLNGMIIKFPFISELLKIYIRLSWCLINQNCLQLCSVHFVVVSNNV